MAKTHESEDWKTYWEINVLFHTSSLPRGKFECLWCGKEEISTSSLRSDFALSALACSAGHCASAGPGRPLSVCFDCDVELVQKATERRLECFKKDCGRYALVDRDRVRRRLDKTLLAEKYVWLDFVSSKETDEAGRYLSLVEKHRIFDCEACCVETISPEQYTDLQATTKCQHDPGQCRDCLRRDIEGRIEAGEWRSIKCPNATCSEELTPRDVDRFVSPGIFNAYVKEKTFEALSQNPKYRTCHDTTCSNGQLVDVNDTDPNWRCSRCAKPNCFTCRNASHCGETCAQAAKLDPQQRDQVEATRRKKCKKCPKRGCRRYIHKIRGCTHMTCSRAGTVGCGTRFCWKCKVIFGTKNGRYEYRHLEGCPMLGGTYEVKGTGSTVPRPEVGDSRYEVGWDEDPDYEAGDSGTESWV